VSLSGGKFTLRKALRAPGDAEDVSITQLSAVTLCTAAGTLGRRNTFFSTAAYEHVGIVKVASDAILMRSVFCFEDVSVGSPTVFGIGKIRRIFVDDVSEQNFGARPIRGTISIHTSKLI